MLISLLFYTFVLVTAIQIIYYLFFSKFLYHDDNHKEDSKNLPISVIICAKNEAENLEKNLTSICLQNYSDFEIVLINDASTDATLEVMQDFASKFKNINIIDVKSNERFWGNKKYALTLGIKAAKNEHLLFTDADCFVVSKNWIKKMSSNFSEQKSIILGYGKYKTTNSSLLSLLVKYETLLTAIQYFSYSKYGLPYMAVGRNLAYKKTDFFKVNGFIKHIKLNSGDDDLFIQQAATATNTTICTDEESFTISKPPTTFKAWFHQKRRHISTSKYYKLKHKLLLALFYASKVTFYLLLVVLPFLTDIKMLLPSIISYYLVLFLISFFSAKKLKEEVVIWSLPFLEICLLCFQFIIFIANIISKPKRWK